MSSKAANAFKCEIEGEGEANWEREWTAIEAAIRITNSPHSAPLARTNDDADINSSSSKFRATNLLKLEHVSFQQPMSVKRSHTRSWDWKFCLEFIINIRCLLDKFPVDCYSACSCAIMEGILKSLLLLEPNDKSPRHNILLVRFPLNFLQSDCSVCKCTFF